jgi:hypothetical protein
MYSRRHQSIWMLFNAFGCIYNILHGIGSKFQCNSMHLKWFQCILMYLEVFECIWMYLNIFECIQMYLNVLEFLYGIFQCISNVLIMYLWYIPMSFNGFESIWRFL